MTHVNAHRFHKIVAAKKRAVRGLSLTETIIVVGVIGLILGGIWGAATQVAQSNRLRTATQQLNAIVQNIRILHAERSGITDTGSTTLTKALDNLRVFPFEMRINSTVASGIIVHPWSTVTSATQGDVYIDADDCSGNAVTTGTAQACFDVTYTNVPKVACAAFLERGASAGDGAQVVKVNGTVAGVANGTPALPIGAGAANVDCGTAVNTILWAYPVKGGGS